MTYTVDRCADCPMVEPRAAYPSNGTCRITKAPVIRTGNPPPTCPLRDSAVTIVIMEGR